ncbi:DUF6074 family protein [Rhizobium sp. ICMP 5592]|uniref:DUF6074 family protein n=1 Tax=Rhizobium sp. ICMP 5592 TaxID=2292445 RepID=UPI002570E8A6|nr:DUF6074 family protein [Rhizobium sp. ICMP 5592]
MQTSIGKRRAAYGTSECAHVPVWAGILRLFERNLLRWFTFYEELAAMVPALLCDSNRNDGDGMTLLQFPADRRTADVRRCAEALQQLHGEAANRFWRSEMAVFAADLREQGVAEDEIGHQAGLFMRAVQMELELVFAAEEALA